MSLGLAYWILMLLWLVLGVWGNRAAFTAGNFAPFGGDLLLFILLVLVGWKVFGAPLQG